MLASLRRGYGASVAAVGPWVTGALLACVIGATVAPLLGIAWLVGVHQADDLFDTLPARQAIAAVKRQAGPRMQARTIEITPAEITIWAMDPEMPPERYVPGNRQHFAHYYTVFGVYEQSWRVTHWRFFKRDWYRVSGPEPAGIIEEKRGPPFDLRPEDIIDLPALVEAARRRAALGDTADIDKLSLDSRGWDIAVWSSPHLVFEQFDRQGQPRGEFRR
jgi:hypothetical protein